MHRTEVRRRGRRQNAAWKPGAGAHHRGSLTVRTLGDRGSPVVLLHGLAASGRYWGAAYDGLARDHRLVVPDLLGFGRSPRPRSGYGPDDHASAVARCLREVGAADEPAVIVGHSLGVLVALRLADRYPELVAGVVGFGPPIAPGLDAIRRRLGAMGPGARLFGLDTRWAELACRAFCEHHTRIAARLARWWRPDLPAEIATDAVEHSWPSYCETLTRVVLPAEAPAWLESIRAPVHLVMGSEDTVPDTGFLESLATRIPNLTTAVWPSANHDVPLVHGPACRVEIEEFLAADRERIARVG